MPEAADPETGEKHYKNPLIRNNIKYSQKVWYSQNLDPSLLNNVQ